jgi:hypothetical protein
MEFYKLNPSLYLFPNNVFSEVLQERRQKAVVEKKEYKDLVVMWQVYLHSSMV